MCRVGVQHNIAYLSCKQIATCFGQMGGGNISFDYETTCHVLVFVEGSFKSVVKLVVGVPVASYSTHVTWKWLVGLCLIGFWD